MPIGAYKPTYLMNKYHIDPIEAFQGYKDLMALKFIPMHYGTYDLSNEPAGEPVRTITGQFELSGRQSELIIPAVGETVFL